MRDEIEAGLRNAIERGFTIENAIQSFISAGYNPVEVKEAASNIKAGSVSPLMQQNKPQSSNSAVSSITSNQANPVAMKSFTTINSPFAEQIQQTSMQKEIKPASQQVQPIQQIQPMQTSQNASQLPKPKSKKGLVITLVIILLVLIGGLALFMAYGNSILKYFLG